MKDKSFDLDAILEEAAARKRERLAQETVLTGSRPVNEPETPPDSVPLCPPTAPLRPADRAAVEEEAPAAPPGPDGEPQTAETPKAKPEEHTRVVELKRPETPAPPEPLPGQVEWSSLGLSETEPEETDEESLRELQEKRAKKAREFRLSGMEEETEPEEEIAEPESPELEDYGSYEETESVRSDLEYRCRTAGMSLALTAILEGILLLLTFLTWLTGSAPFEPVLYLLGNAFLLGLMMVINHRLTGSGLSNLLRGRADTASAAAVPCVPVLIHTLAQLSHLGAVQAGDSVLTAAAGLSLLAGAAGRFWRLTRIAGNFRFVSFPGEKTAVTLIAEADSAAKIGRTAVAEGVPRVVYARPASFLTGFLTHAYADDALDRQMRRIVPMGLALAFLPALAYAVWQGDWWLSFSAFTVTACLLFPCAPLLSGAALLGRASRRALKEGAMIGGSEASEVFGDVDAAAVEAEDLFLPEQLLLHGIRTFKGARIDEAIMDAAAVSISVGGPLASVFRRIIADRVEILPSVDSPVYEQDMGVSGWVDGRRVLVGNRRLLQNHGVDVPSDAYEARYATDGRQLVYLSTGGELSAMYILSYLPDEETAGKCRELARCRVDLLIRSCDPNVTDSLVCEAWDLDDYHVTVMDGAASRAFAAQPRDPAPCPAVLATDGRLSALAAALTACHRLRRGFALSRVLQLAGALIGLVIGMTLLFAVRTVLPPPLVVLTGLCGTLIGWLLPMLCGS